MTSKKRKRTCRLLPGTRFGTPGAARQAQNERKINSGVNGQHGAVEYEIKRCACTGFHLIAVTSG